MTKPGTSRNYIRGRAKEYRVKKSYEARGYVVLRTAGSHGFADLIVINKEAGVIKFIQCKPKNFGKIAESILLKEHNWINNEFQCYFSVE